MNRRVYIIIPVYNEEKVIRSVLSEVKKAGFHHIIVVDDGSTDNTSKEAQKEHSMIVRHALNRGKGAAIKTGIETAKQLGASLIVTFDGDGQHDPKDIEKLITVLDSGYDVVLGSRFLLHQEIPFYKRMANYIANCITYLLYGIWVTDSQSGLRAYTMRTFTNVDTHNDRYGFDTEILRTIRKNHLSYKEIPMCVRYTDYSQKKKNRQDATSAILTMVKVILSS